ncbi:MAG: hypothetical protein IJT14_04255 [Rickettsiales bacterium]|nr:hypothetical protein [Rickettsiales bacterium]
MKYTKTMVDNDRIAISVIKNRPSGKKHEPIIREIDLDEKYDILIGWLKKKIGQGERVFWVCPLINKSHRLKYMDVHTRYRELCKVFGESEVLLIHGKMTQDKKDEVLKQFKDDFSKKIMVATQVIEVGIDIPHVNIMVIEDREVFGEAQFKQLVGRVGRG